jgi:hypothetical protein
VTAEAVPSLSIGIDLETARIFAVERAPAKALSVGPQSGIPLQYLNNRNGTEWF